MKYVLNYSSLEDSAEINEIKFSCSEDRAINIAEIINKSQNDRVFILIVKSTVYSVYVFDKIDTVIKIIYNNNTSNFKH